MASSLTNLGLVEFVRGDLDKAEEYERQALVIMEKLAPGSLVVAGSLNILGNVEYNRGDLAKAEAPVSPPFSWTVTPDSILEKIQRLCEPIFGTQHRLLYVLSKT